MKVLVILEFGIPHYRDFLFDYLNNHPKIKELLIIHTGEKFPSFQYHYRTLKVKYLKIGSFKFHLETIQQIPRFDTIISSFNIYRPLCYMPILFFKRKKWILWSSGLGRNRLSFINARFRRFFVNQAKHLIVYTSSAREGVVKTWNIPENKVKVAGNTLKITNSILSAGKGKYFLYVGRLQERKGILKAIQSIKSLKEKGFSYRLKIVGDGEIMSELVQYVKENNLTQNISFHPGCYDNSKLQDYFTNAICYLSPDHVGLGVVHSFAYGIPVLTCRSKKHAEEFEYCSDDNSFLYDYDYELESFLKLTAENPVIVRTKGGNAFEFYNSRLDYQIMNKTFIECILD